MEFKELPIPEPVMQGLRDCGFSSCTSIQELTLPLTLAGRDVAGQAQTGTGKTAAFLIACFTRLLENDSQPGSDREGQSEPRCLIIAPTRELAVQIENDAVKIGGHTGIRIGAVYGGVGYDQQREMLASGGVDLLIGTPGRLIDYFKQKVWAAKRVEALVIDEADRMFDMGFIADLRYMLRRMPPYDQRLSMLFSATLSYRAQELSYEYMDHPEVLTVEPEMKTAEKVRQQLYYVEGRRKISLMVGLLRRDLAESESGPGGRVMIFVNTKRMGERLESWLEKNGIPSGYLSGDVPQSQRLKVLTRFQEGKIPVLIATDVAGRGLHIEGVTHVINYDLPDNPEDYVHRIGRTARAGAHGDAISLVDEDGAYNLEAVLDYLGMKIPATLPDESLFAKLEVPPRPPRSEEDDRRGRGRGRRESGGGRERTRSGRGGGERHSSRGEGGHVAATPETAATETPAPIPETTPEVGNAVEGVPPPDAAPQKKRRRRRRRKGTSAGSATPPDAAATAPVAGTSEE